MFLVTPAPLPDEDLLQPSRLCRQCDERASRRMSMLQEVAEIGMKLARSVERQVVDRAPEDPDGAAASPALVFSRISRAVRQTIALEARLDRELHEARKAEDAARADHARIATRTLARRRKHVRDVVQQALEADACGPELEALLADLDERLDDVDDDADFAELPIGRIVARICRQLGVVPDPALWEDAPRRTEAATTIKPLQ